jgi:hypothetical protein
MIVLGLLNEKPMIFSFMFVYLNNYYVTVQGFQSLHVCLSAKAQAFETHCLPGAESPGTTGAPDKMSGNRDYFTSANSPSRK